MTFPHIFATQAAGNVPASYLDVDFSSVLAGTAGPFTQAEIDFTKAISGAANPANQALYMTGTMSGTTSDFSWAYQQIIMAESLDNSGAGGGATVNGLYVGHAGYGGSAARNGLLAVYSHNAVTTTPSSSAFYTGVFSNVPVSSTDGGGSGTEKGAFFGFGGIVSVASAATHLAGVCGAEFDVSLQSGSSTLEKILLQLVNVNGDIVKGSITDAMMVMTGDGANSTFHAVTGFDNGILFGKPGCQWPISSTGTIIGVASSMASGASPGGGTYNTVTAAYGIDFSAVTFSTGAFKSAGFLVDQFGNTTVNSLVSNNHIQAATEMIVANPSGGYWALQSAGGIGFRWSLSNNSTFVLQRTVDGFGTVTSSPVLIDASDNTGFAQSITANYGSSVGAGVSTQAFIKGSTTANLGIFYGTGAPSFSAAQGSIYTNTTASVATARAFVNTNGSTGWAFFTASA